MIQELRAQSRIHLLRVLFQNVLFRVPLLLHLSKSTSDKNNFFSSKRSYTSFQADLKKTCKKRRYQYQHIFRLGKMSSKIQSYDNQRGLKISRDIKKISKDIYPLYQRIFSCLTSKVHNKITNVPQNFCCLTHKEILMCLSLTLSYKYHDIQPISFSYSFFASSLLIPDKCGNATVASILLFLKKTSN